MKPEYVHTAVGVIAVIVEREQILLVLSKDRGWEPPMGFLEPGESPIPALHREVLEESGYSVNVVRLAGIYHCINNGLPIISMSFVCVPHERITDQVEESLDVCWVKIKEIDNYITRPSHRLRVVDALERRSTVLCEYRLDPFSVIKSWAF